MIDRSDIRWHLSRWRWWPRLARNACGRAVVRHLYPQRAFVTFRPDALIENARIETDGDGTLTITALDGCVLRNVNTYDAMIVPVDGEVRVTGLRLTARYEGRPLVRADAGHTVIDSCHFAYPPSGGIITVPRRSAR